MLRNDPAVERELLAAAEESGLADRYRGDDVLLRIYMWKLLQPGWAGRLDEVERRYRRCAKRRLGCYVPDPPPTHRFRRTRRAVRADGEAADRGIAKARKNGRDDTCPDAGSDVRDPESISGPSLLRR